MISLDIIFLVVLLLFVMHGIGRGLVAAATGLAGLIFTGIVTFRAHPVIMTWLEGAGANIPVFWQMIIFFVLFALFGYLVGLVVKFIVKIFKVISAIPFTKSIDRLLGAVFGFFEGIVMILLLVFILVSVPELSPPLVEAIDSSWIVEGVLLILGAVSIIFPASWQQLIENSNFI
jgi:uncharacterized membrane protein required for colicin V production